MKSRNRGHMSLDISQIVLLRKMICESRTLLDSEAGSPPSRLYDKIVDAEMTLKRSAQWRSKCDECGADLPLDRWASPNALDGKKEYPLCDTCINA